MPAVKEDRKIPTSVECIAKAIDACREHEGCGHPPCGRHAVGKPTHLLGIHTAILVVGEAPAPDGWWLTGQPFYRKRPSGGVKLSRAGVNLNQCLAILGTSVERAGFVEAVKCRPGGSEAWRPTERVRQRCRHFLFDYLLVTQPRLVLPLGLTATASCLEVTFQSRPKNFATVVGVALEWIPAWGSCWILPLYHPSPANSGRWPSNLRFLRKFVKECPQVKTACPAL
jgi:uracil-DNA glycosylase family 4